MSTPPEIYLDHHAATPVDARVAAEMARARAMSLGNPASPHGPGRRARALLEEARARVARAVGADAAEIVLTSGGTEACNLGVLGLVRASGRVVTTAIEHPAVAEPVATLERRGHAIVRLGFPDGTAPDDAEVRVAVRGAALFAVQFVNHETGTLLPVARWSAIAADADVPAFVDATQALGKIAIDWPALGASGMALASHKIGGPAGAGALVVRRAAVLAPQLLGGAQERGLRAGTPDVVAMVGFGVACTLLDERLAAQSVVARRRDRLEAFLIARGGRINGGPSRVATVVDASMPGWRSSTLVAALDLEGLAVASGAACSSGVETPSPVVRAMSPDDPSRASSAIRLSLGPETSDEEIDRAIAILDRVLSRAPA